MSATAATTARPPATAIAWATADALYCEIPCANGPPFILREHRTAEGLGRLLNVLITHAERPSSGKIATAPTQAAHPAIRRPKPTFNEQERAGVRNVLKKAGII